MKIGYCRCSTVDQNTARQEKILKELGCEKIYTDMVSGKNRDRPGLQEMMNYIREGDILYVESISLNTPIWRSRVSGETKASFLESDSE